MVIRNITVLPISQFYIHFFKLSDTRSKNTLHCFFNQRFTQVKMPALTEVFSVRQHTHKDVIKF